MGPACPENASFFWLSYVYSGTRVSGASFPNHAIQAMGPDLWLTPSTYFSFVTFLRGLREAGEGEAPL